MSCVFLYSDSELNTFSLKNVELRLRFQRHHCELGMLLFFLKGSLRLDSPILKRMLELQRQFNLKKRIIESQRQFFFQTNEIKITTKRTFKTNTKITKTVFFETKKKFTKQSLLNE